MTAGKIPSSFTISGAVSDGSYDTARMDRAFERIYLGAIRFFNAAGAQVTPSAGSVSFTASPDGVNFQTVQNGSFSAADAYLSTRAMPAGMGPAIVARLSLSGVTGAASFEATIDRY